MRGKHAFQFGGEYRRMNLTGEFQSRTNGDLDYDTWALFFTGHGAAGGGFVRSVATEEGDAPHEKKGCG